MSLGLGSRSTLRLLNSRCPQGAQPCERSRHGSSRHRVRIRSRRCEWHCTNCHGILQEGYHRRRGFPACESYENEPGRRRHVEWKQGHADIVSISNDDLRGGNTADHPFLHRQDASINGEATGAMSWAFINALKKNPQQSYVQLLNSIRDELSTKYTQKPQLSCSHPLSTKSLLAGATPSCRLTQTYEAFADPCQIRIFFTSCENCRKTELQWKNKTWQMQGQGRGVLEHRGCPCSRAFGKVSWILCSYALWKVCDPSFSPCTSLSALRIGLVYTCLLLHHVQVRVADYKSRGLRVSLLTISGCFNAHFQLLICSAHHCQARHPRRLSRLLARINLPYLETSRSCSVKLVAVYIPVDLNRPPLALLF